MFLLLLAGLLQAPAADYPRQRPIAPVGIESCRIPEYSDEQYRAMAAVTEIRDAREPDRPTVEQESFAEGAAVQRIEHGGSAPSYRASPAGPMNTSRGLAVLMPAR